ncbi:MAG: L-seryl-tRNA(Sec) selenium transferase [Caldilineaceae bacterium SB0662_bin_9]|uniref:L-seryl-tRNA(Sec) selenium transferase n=1 Tax=Caldilineaceae bacterium SB0662_bin_9 TaxID=2605258 RepID=A0A6B1DTR2_9CHLR|nr:L-seryl-tRNA(Sec) selenium transferase [Caldilineaceae bacterium]MYD89754.1 L-seryl-tRNA(Sec) selenium transferase [Caldilineaceae bacterium SB0662_bin_9]
MNTARELRRLPALHRLLETEVAVSLANEYGQAAVVAGARKVLAAVRTDTLERGEPVPDATGLADRLAEWMQANLTPTLTPVVNATGVILHTNLGRAPLSHDALSAIQQVGLGYSNLEFDLATGARSDRYRHSRRVLAYLTGAEDAVVVNNNAAALMLILAAYCKGREVVISRGQMVEVGGGFRIPDILEQSGAHLREVGTTNRTYVSDYLEALSDRTAAVLVVHASNFHQVGYTVQPELADLVSAVRGTFRDADRPLVLHDLGSGLLMPLGGCLEAEHTVADSVSAGADLVAFSGDKLLGGPQAGVVVGSAGAVAPLLRHPLLRALRVDKLILAALGATLEPYVRDEATVTIPALSMASKSAAELKTRAEALCRTLSGHGVPVTTVDLYGAAGGGSMPGTPIPGAGIAVRVDRPDMWSASLRAGKPPVVTVIRHGQLVLDLRTVFPDQDQVLVQALLTVHGR